VTNARVNVMSILSPGLTPSMFFLSSTIRVTVRPSAVVTVMEGTAGSTALTVTVALDRHRPRRQFRLRALQRGFEAGAAGLFTRLDELQNERLVIGDVHLLADLELVEPLHRRANRECVFVPLVVAQRKRTRGGVDRLDRRADHHHIGFRDRGLSHRQCNCCHPEHPHQHSRRSCNHRPS